MPKHIIVPRNSDESEEMEHKCIVTRNSAQKNFGSFVDKVLEEIPMSNASVKHRYRFREDNDPVAVLHNRGLLNIERALHSPSSDSDSSSEVDLTFYTQESRLGEIVKGFCSNHRFRNGDLIYSTTQEISPQLPEDIKKFAEWWKLQARRRKRRQEGGQHENKQKSHRKKFADTIKEFQKQELIKRYESSSIEQFQKYPVLKSPLQEHSRRKEYRKHSEAEPRTKDLGSILELKHLLQGFHNRIINPSEFQARRQNANFHPQRVEYQASWKHKSPKKSPVERSAAYVIDKNSDIHDNEMNASSNQPKTSQKIVATKMSSSKIDEKAHHRNSRESSPAHYTRSGEFCSYKHKSISPECRKCTSAPGVSHNLKTDLRDFRSIETDQIMSCHHHRRPYKKDRSYIEQWLKAEQLACLSGMGFDPKIASPLIAEADFNQGTGDAENNQIISDAHTSICSLNYTKEHEEGDTEKIFQLEKEMKAKPVKQHYEIGNTKGTRPETSNPRPNARYYIDKSATLPYSSQKPISPQKSVQFDNASQFCKRRSKSDGNGRCYAACHKQSRMEKKVIFMKDAFNKPCDDRNELNALKGKDALMQAKAFVNKEALKEFSSKYCQSWCG